MADKINKINTFDPSSMRNAHTRFEHDGYRHSRERRFPFVSVHSYTDGKGREIYRLRQWTLRRNNTVRLDDGFEYRGINSLASYRAMGLDWKAFQTEIQNLKDLETYMAGLGAENYFVAKRIIGRFPGHYESAKEVLEIGTVFVERCKYLGLVAPNIIKDFLSKL